MAALRQEPLVALASAHVPDANEVAAEFDRAGSATAEFDVVGIGNALVDVIAHADEAFILR